MKRCSTARSRASVSVHSLESRYLMSAAFDLTGLTAMRADANFAGIDGSGVAVAVLDTGIFGLHPQLRPNVLAYYNAVSNPIPTSINVTSVNASLDGNGHGSHVAGTVASNNPDIGVAPAAKIVAVKVLSDPGEAQIGGDPMLRGLQFVERYANQFNIKVVNMSIQTATASGGLNINFVPNPDAVSRQIDSLEAMGITVVSATGNSYANAPVPGSSSPGVISTVNVANVWSDTGPGHDFSGLAGQGTDQYVAVESSAAPDRFAASSQRSTLPNQVAAPGVDIFSTWNGAPGIGGQQLFNTISGTSMASPFVSGLVALMQDAAFTYGGQYFTDPELVLDILRDTADLVVDSNVSDNARLQIVNGALNPTPLNLPETGETFMRVNAHAALNRVRNIMLGGGLTGDINNTTGSATSIPSLTTGGSAARRRRIGADGLIIVGPNDIDLFKVTLTAAGDLSATLAPVTGGLLFTPSLRVFDAAGNEIAQADGVGLNYPGLRTNPATPLTPGVYYVGVSSMANVNYVIANGAGIANGLSEGDYDLIVSLTSPDVNGVATGAGSLDLTVPDTLAFASEISTVRAGIIGADDPLPGTSLPNLVPSGDVDMFTFVAPDDGTLQARTLSRATPGGAVVNTFVRIFDSNLAELGANDNNPAGGLDSLLDVPVLTGQTYYIGITNAINGGFNATDSTGRVINSTTVQEPYDLYLNFTSGDVDGTAVTAVARPVGTPAPGAIGTDNGTVVGATAGAKDVDFSVFAAPASGLLDLQVAGAVGLQSVLALWQYNTTEHTIIKLGEAAGASPRLIRQVGPGQILYASVTGLGNEQFNWFSVASGTGGQTGAYTLNSILRPVSDLTALNDGSVQAGTPVALTVGAPAVGDLGTDGPVIIDADVDVYSFVPAATGRYDIRTDTSAEESGDTVLRLFDSAGNPVAMNDDATGVTNSSALRVPLTGGQTYYIGISGAGAGSTGYNVLTGAGSAVGSHGTYGLVVSPTAAGAPAVRVSDAASTQEVFRVGSTATFTISLDAPATGAVTVAYATNDGTATSGTDYTATSGVVTFAPGETVKTITVPVTGDALVEGEESFGVDIAVISGAEAVVGDEHALAAVVNQEVQSVGFNSALRATFTDADGGRVVVSLRGPGSGELLLLGGGPADAAGITLTGTTAASVLTVTGDTTIGDVTVNGALKGFMGRTLDLLGNLGVAGSLSQLRLRSFRGDAISAGGGALRAVLGDIVDGAITSAGSIKSLRVGQWVDNDGAGDLLAATSIGSILATGNFGADVSTGSIGKMTVGGTLTGADVRATGKIGAVRAGAATGSRVFAGVRSDVATLPDGVDDFVDPAAAIGSFTITGRAGTFSNTHVAAPTIGKVLLGQVQTSNGGTPFGVAADVLKSIRTPTLRLARLELPSASRTEADFNVRIL